MGCYMITHSLLSSWLYSMKENPYIDATTEPEDPMAEFLPVLRRDPTPTTDAMQKGIDFENLGSVKKFVCLDILKPNSIMQHEPDSEHSSPLSTLPLGAGCNI